MNYDELINSIVEEVYKRIKENSVVVNSVTKKKAVVLWDKDMDKYSKISANYNVIAYEDGIRDYDVVVVSALCLRGLANLALGISVSSEERFILKALMMGKKVYVLESGIEYKRYKETAPKEIYKKYISFEREIRNYGIQVIDNIEALLDARDVVKTNNVEVSASLNETKEDVVELKNKRLISESDLRRPQIRGAKTIVIDKKTMITPLAADYIRINNLKVERV